MAVGELLLSAFFQVLFDRLASRELLDFAGQEKVSSKLKRWEETLMMIQAVLTDAEEKQFTDGSVKMWLDNLRDLAYDSEDILDAFATEALRRKLVAEHQTSSCKVRSLITDSITSLKFNFSMGSKIIGITSRLEHLCKQRNELGLQVIPGGILTAASERRRPPCTSVPTETAIYGRDEDKAKLLEMVLREEPIDARFCIITIVGMAGLGKTTLAREVYNDKEVDDFKFEIKAWVCVSDDFDVLKISKALLETINSSPCGLNDLNEVQIQLKKAVDGKKFLLVLDDVWNKNYGLWETLKSPFIAGAPGSKIIVTTRNVDVASTIGSSEYYELKSISDDDCWSIFVKHAFDNRDIDALQIPELIRKKVIEKCGGLPLAAKTLGGLLRSNQRDGAWEGILNSRIWDLSKESGILPVLRLSYHDFPSHLKRCFSYCAIFPKDYEFEEKELVFLWMAEGIIHQSQKDKQLEDIGSEYFHDLLSRSIFQPSNSNSSKFVMHNLVNDLAEWVAGDTSFRLEEANKQLKRFERARHSSYICTYYDGQNKFEVFHKLERLRTFLPVLMSGYGLYRGSHITEMVLSDLLPKFRKLRVLSLRRYYITKLPNSIGGLVHLRYLNLSRTLIRSLPESTCMLLNLQVLILRDCSRLKNLPSKMRNLINLRHLDITGVNLLTEMPLGMKDLKHLQTLSNFIVGKGVGSDLKDLKYLKFLHGELCISGLENVIDSQQRRDAILSDKKDLEVLSLQWKSQFDASRNELVEEEILDMLQPHRNLKSLTIKCYGGKRFPFWVGDPLFSKMVVLTLENCENCTFLPSLGLLDLLKELTIKGMAGLKSIGSEIYGEGCVKPFQSLKMLSFENLPAWEYWEPMEENEQIVRFPHLRELSIKKCPKLFGKLPERLPSLETFVINECEQLVVSFSSFPMLSKLEIEECKGTVFTSPPESKSLKSMTLSKTVVSGSLLIQDFHKVELLRIVGCEELIGIWQNEICLEKPLQGMHSLTSLKKLSIANCTSLVLFPEFNFLPMLSSLKIENCNALKSLPEGIKHNNAALESLQIEGCSSLTFIFRGILPSSLKRLEVKNCENLQCLFDDGEYICTSSSPANDEEHRNNTSSSLLEYLSVLNCQFLVCISSRRQLPPKLKHIEIMNCRELLTLSSRMQLPEELESLNISTCSKLESAAERFHNNTCLRSISFWNCQHLKCIPEGLYSLSCLQNISIQGCPSLVSFPAGGLPDTNLSVTIGGCVNLEALPDSLHKLNSLQKLHISQCPSIISFPERGFPTNLITLSIEDLSIFKPLIEWGLHKLTSLRHLSISGCLDAVSFPQEEIGMMLPTSLTWLCIEKFPKLMHLSSLGFQSLTSLEFLFFIDCPKLTSLPAVGLPSSLLGLYIDDCPLLKRKCMRKKGQEWSKIAHIPCVKIDNKFIYDLEKG